MNPYYMVFYGKAIQKQLMTVGAIFARHGYISADLAGLKGRDLALAVAEGMISFAKSINAPVTLRDIKGFTEEHIKRALAAAKDPQLDMKLKNMPVPLTAAKVDEYMGPIIRSAVSGDFSQIKSMAS